MAMFEAVHGSAPDIAGMGIANPTALLWSACMMLDHIGLKSSADLIRDAIDAVMLEGLFTTRDIGGTASTREYTDAIIRRIALLRKAA